ncbi:hypothetical protein [uncultured Ilyobacter sp.]|uniref:hypothetical protein n=1 Tax=uncultured Ilyobacter sp. TaxID=544433 RepID=UPI002AA94386|nr:hypothetical protein [uncultured Ilyobacter sp.]
MKKLLFLFLTVYTFTFAITDFPSLKWKDGEFDILMSFPGIEEDLNYLQDTKILSKENPKEKISSYKFHMKNESLYKIEVIFDSSKIKKSDIKEIYETLEKTMGQPVSRNPIDINLGDMKLKGNSITFFPDNETTVFLKGIDTLDKDDTMTNSQLILEYRDNEMLNIIN